MIGYSMRPEYIALAFSALLFFLAGISAGRMIFRRPITAEVLEAEAKQRGWIVTLAPKRDSKGRFTK